MAWRWTGNKPLTEPMLFSSLTLMCCTGKRWVNARDFVRSRLPFWIMLTNEIILYLDSQIDFEGNLSNIVLSTVPAYCLALSGARPSTGTELTKYIQNWHLIIHSYDYSKCFVKSNLFCALSVCKVGIVTRFGINRISLIPIPNLLLLDIIYIYLVLVWDSSVNLHFYIIRNNSIKIFCPNRSQVTGTHHLDLEMIIVNSLNKNLNCKDLYHMIHIWIAVCHWTLLFTVPWSLCCMCDIM